MRRATAPRALRGALLALAVAWLLYAELPEPAAGPPLAWRGDVDSALREARDAGRPALLSFHAAWCSVCNELDRATLRDPSVASELARFALVRVDADAESGRQRMESLGVVALPALVFVDSRGAPLEQPRPQGFLSAEELLPLLRAVASDPQAPRSGARSEARPSVGWRARPPAPVPN